MNKTNILFLTTSFVIGGAEKVILDLMLNLDKQKFDISIIALAKNADMLDEYIDSGIKSTKLGMNKNIFDFISVFYSLSKYISGNKIDILHAHLVHTLPFQALLKIRHPKLRIVYTPHNVDVGGKHRDVLTWITKPFRSVDIVFSKGMMNKLYKKNAVVIINGVNTEKFNKKPRKNKIFTFISVGSIRDQKNQIFLVECAEKLKSKKYNFIINIVGGGEENAVLIKKIEKEIVDKKVSGFVQMLGSRSDIPELLQTSHCMVLPSHYEGLPIVLLEAGAAKLPIISTSVGAIPTFLDENNGYLTSLESFSEVMASVMDNYEEAEKKAELLKDKVVKSYSIKSMAKAHTDLYNTLVSIS